MGLPREETEGLGVRYSVNRRVVRKIVADTRAGAEAELEQLKEDHNNRRLGLVEGKTLRDLPGRSWSTREQSQVDGGPLSE